MMLRLRRCTWQLRKIPSNLNGFCSTPTNLNSKATETVNNIRKELVVNPAIQCELKATVHENVTDNSYKFFGKQSLLTTLQEFQKQNKHSNVLDILNSLKKTDPTVIDTDVISTTIISAVASKLPLTVVSLIDFGLSQGVINSDLALTYIRSCKECSGDSQPGMWSKSVAMLEAIISVDNKSTNQSAATRKVMEQCFEEALILCASSGKWRNVLDIIEKIQAYGCPPTERTLSAAVICCAREPNGLASAHGMFLYMAKFDIPRSRKVYSALLQGYVKAKLFDKYELVWAQMMVDKITGTDNISATRIEVYAAQGDLEQAELTLKEAVTSIKRPRQSYNALYIALLRSGNTEKALDLVKTMRETGVQPPEHHTASFHLHSLSKVGSVEEGLRFLRKQEQDYDAFCLTTREGDTSKDKAEGQEEEVIGRVSEAAWQSLFRASTVHGKFIVAEEVLNYAIERQAARRSSPPTPQLDTTLWLSQLFRTMSKAGEWRQALTIADKHQPLSNSDLSILLKALCQCEQDGEAVKYHHKSLDALLNTRPPSSKGSKSGSNNVEKFFRTVSHGFIQQLASEHKGDNVIEALDGVHDCIDRHKTRNSPPLGPPAADQKAPSPSQSLDRLTASLPVMYTSAIRYPVGRARSLEQAQRLMNNQRKHLVTPLWSCTRYAMKAMSEEAAWEQLLDVFAARAQSTDYLPGDEVAYTSALRGCIVLGRWPDALEIFADLLFETDTPSATVFELTLEALASQDQWEMMTEVVSVIRDRQVTPTPRMIALCSAVVPSILREQLLRKIRDVPSSDMLLVDGGKESGQPSQGQGSKKNKGKVLTKKSKKSKKVSKMKKLKPTAEGVSEPSQQLGLKPQALSKKKHTPKKQSNAN